MHIETTAPCHRHFVGFPLLLLFLAASLGGGIGVRNSGASVSGELVMPSGDVLLPGGAIARLEEDADFSVGSEGAALHEGAALVLAEGVTHLTVGPGVVTGFAGGFHVIRHGEPIPSKNSSLGWVGRNRNCYMVVAQNGCLLNCRQSTTPSAIFEFLGPYLTE